MEKFTRDELNLMLEALRAKEQLTLKRYNELKGQAHVHPELIHKLENRLFTILDAKRKINVYKRTLKKEG